MSKSKKMRGLQLRVGSLLFVIILFMGAFPSTVFAEAVQDDPAVNTWQALQEAINNAGSGDTITLTADIKAGESDTVITVPNGAMLILDLNGHTVDRALKKPGGNEGSAFHILSGAMLTVTDSSEAVAGKITGGYASAGGDINNDGTLILEGGCITKNVASDSGGGIINYGNLVITNGSITENTALTEGGGIYNAVKGYMTLEKAVVYGNSAPKEADIRNTGSMKAIGGVTVNYTSIRTVLDMVAVLPTLVLLIVLFFSVCLDNYMGRSRKRAMYIITILVFTLVIQNYLDTWLYLSGKWIMLRTVISIYGYAVRPAVLATFLHIIRPGVQYKIVWAAVSVNAVLYLTALFSPLTFSFSSYGHFISEPLNHVCLLLSAVLFLYCIYMTLKVFRPKERKESWIPVLALLLIGLSVALDYTVEYNEQSVSFLTIAIAISSLMYYIWLHLQFVREHERSLQAEHRIQIMMTQIQPHFLFNTLTAIRALCVKDQAAAVHTIGLFSAYLRQNLESLNQTAVIPLSKELEHTRIYSEIEMIRFPNIRIEYDIRDREYGVPALTVQPLVENAIRHGVRSREEGIVKITAYRKGTAHIIVIEDNGIGFNEQSANEADGMHIGISNVRERLERMCLGTMTIDSRPGEGTKIVLEIPVSKETNN